MDKKIIIWVVAIVVILGFGVYIVFNNGMYKMGSTNTNNSQTVSTNKVTISNYSFQPSNITVKAGTTVTWTNNDSITHHVKADDGSFDLGDLAARDSYTYTFAKTGSFLYHCTIHPSMTGTVTVN